MKNLKKKFCKNCKHFYAPEFTRRAGWCGKEILVYKNKEFMQSTGLKNVGTWKELDCKEANKNNDCTHYKRKWGMIWIS